MLELVQETLAVLGVAALLYGLAQWSGPAAWIVGGLLAGGPFLVATWRRRR